MTSPLIPARALALSSLLLAAGLALGGCSGGGADSGGSAGPDGEASADADAGAGGGSDDGCTFTEVPDDSDYAAYIDTVELASIDIHLAPQLLPTSVEPNCVFVVTYKETEGGAVESYAVYFPIPDGLFDEAVGIVESAGFTYQSRTRPEFDPASGFWGGSTGPDLTGDYVLIANNESRLLAESWGVILPDEVPVALVHYTVLETP